MIGWRYESLHILKDSQYELSKFERQLILLTVINLAHSQTISMCFALTKSMCSCEKYVEPKLGVGCPYGAYQKVIGTT